MKDIDIPVVLGPGSQPPDSDGAEMSFMHMPSGMNTYESPIVPEPEEIVGLEAAIAAAHELLSQLQGYRVGEAPRVIDLSGLDERNRQLIDQLLGEGEVSVQYNGDLQALIQESLLAGVWRVQYLDHSGQVIRDSIEVADIPSLVSRLTFEGAAERIDTDRLDIPESVYNAPPLLAEIDDQLQKGDDAERPYIINLSLLPHTEEDLLFLSERLGIGPVVVLSRGYGNCRISSTRTRGVWWVQYFNSQETLILNTLEISPVPEVACAAQEDILDSERRLREILTIYD